MPASVGPAGQRGAARFDRDRLHGRVAAATTLIITRPPGGASPTATPSRLIEKPGEPASISTGSPRRITGSALVGASMAGHRARGGRVGGADHGDENAPVRPGAGHDDRVIARRCARERDGGALRETQPRIDRGARAALRPDSGGW